MVSPPVLQRQNKFFHAQSIATLISKAPETERAQATAQVDKIKAVYAGFAKTYASTKGSQDIPLS